VARTAPPISPASINIEKNRLLGFDPSNAIDIIDKVKCLNYILLPIVVLRTLADRPSHQATLSSLRELEV
jgi:hypothetical protein